MILDLSITDLARGLRQKKFSSEEMLRESLATIRKYQNEVNAFITLVDEKEVLRQAREKDNGRTDDASPLYGLPFVLKDTYVTRGIRTTAASNVLSIFIPPYSATVYRRLIDAGAILVGKANMDAWGHGATSENTDFGPVKNPWNTKHAAGGSTGGVAAAIAMRMVAFGIGEDTGGSIRNPSAWCNITGLKVTYGRVSRYGCIAYASSFDTVGPMAKSTEDCALVLETIAGNDPHDATSAREPVEHYSNRLSEPVKGMVLGVPKECFEEGLDEEIKTRINEAIAVYKDMGVEVHEVSLPTLDYGVAAYYLIAPSETSSNLARYDGVRYGQGRDSFTRETRRRIMVGTHALSAGYHDALYTKAQQVRTRFIEEYKKAFSQCDVMIMPVTPTHPTKLGETISDPIKNMLIDFYTVTHNPAGIPSLAIPCGFSAAGFPVGMQLTCPMFGESLLFRFAHHYQTRSFWHTKKPPLLAG